MLSRIPQTRTARALRWSVVAAQRGLVQPSGADRARIVDVPPSYKEGHFAPSPGSSILHLSLSCRVNPCVDMLGFKLANPARESVATQKARPIYLDMQVREEHW